MSKRISARQPRVRTRRSGFVLLIALGAVLAGSAFALGTQRSLLAKPPESPPVVGEFDSIKIPVPVEFIPAGTAVRKIRFKSVAFPQHQVPEDALRSTEGLEEAYTIAPLPANLPLFRANFALSSQTSNAVLERIPPGLRAMTVRVDATSSVEGWAGSGSVVDVLLIEKDRTIVVAEKVKVLSAERSVSPVEGAAAPAVPNTVTLLVTQEQCLAINTAIPLGRIAFALRSVRDEEIWSDRVFTREQLRTGSSSLPPGQDGAGQINGYVSVRYGDQARAYALTNGRWIRTESVPDGFLVGKHE